MKDIKLIESYTPQQAADMLHVTPSTLRKYCGLVTKYHGKEYFKRDASNARIFSRHDVDLLNRIADLKKAPNVTLDNAVLIALNQEASTPPVTLVTAADTSDKAANEDVIATLYTALTYKTKTAAAVPAKPSLFGNWFKRP